MDLPFPAPARLAATGAMLALFLLTLGCASDGDRPRPPHGAGRGRPFPTMAGEEKFFDGRIGAEVLVGAMTGFEPGEPGAGGGGGGGQRRHGGGMHLGGGGGGRRHEGGEMGGPEGPGDGGADPESSGNVALRRADAMGSAPVMIHVRFTNLGAEKAELVIADFSSPLGNFVVRPDKLVLEPGQSLAIDPMTSRLAGEVTSGEVSLRLKLGASDETKTIALALRPEPPPPADDAPATPAR